VRTLGLGMCVILILAVSALLDQESGIGIWLELREDLSGSAARAAQLVRENDEMRREIEMLEADPAALDRAIREELDVALPGEIVVRFTNSEGARQEASAEGDRGWSLHGLFPSERLNRETR
jgi:cell division protein FtsB